jgi:hypothetical protein
MLRRMTANTASDTGRLGRGILCRIRSPLPRAALSAAENAVRKSRKEYFAMVFRKTFRSYHRKLLEVYLSGLKLI